MHSAASLPTRLKPRETTHLSKRKGRQSTTGESDRPQSKRPRATSSQARTQKTSLKQEVSDQATGSSSEDEPGTIKATLYDAVAGRVGYEGFLLDKGGQPVPPDQVLFSRADAPVRYQEDDQYEAHRHIPPDHRLPDSDILKAVHAYASDFYGSGKLKHCRDDFKSLDETALLAMGILIEEAVAQSLGNSGDLAFVESPQRENMP